MTVEIFANKAVESANLVIGVFKCILDNFKRMCSEVFDKCDLTELFFVSNILKPWRITCDSHTDGEIWSVMIANEGTGDNTRMRDTAREAGDKVVNQCFSRHGSSRCISDHLFELERV